MNITDNLKGRFDALGPHAKSGLESAFSNAVDFIALPAAKRAEFAKDDRRSPAGVADEVRKFAVRGVVPELRRARRLVEEGRADIAARRAALSRPKIDPADTLGMAYRQEARMILRGLSDGERMQRVLSSELFMAAALEVPELAGLSGTALANVERTYIEKHHAPAIAALDAREEALTALQSAASIAAQSLQAQSGLDKGPAFNGWFETAGEPGRQAA